MASLQPWLYAVLRRGVRDQPARCSAPEEGARATATERSGESSPCPRSSSGIGVEAGGKLPGDPRTGILSEDEEPTGQFDIFANDEVLPRT